MITAASSGKAGMMICVPVLPARKVMIPSLDVLAPEPYGVTAPQPGIE